MRFFNTEGPVRSDGHYCVPPLRRWDLDGFPLPAIVRRVTDAD